MNLLMVGCRFISEYNTSKNITMKFFVLKEPFFVLNKEKCHSRQKMVISGRNSPLSLPCIIILFIQANNLTKGCCRYENQYINCQGDYIFNNCIFGNISNCLFTTCGYKDKSCCSQYLHFNFCSFGSYLLYR